MLELKTDKSDCADYEQRSGVVVSSARLPCCASAASTELDLENLIEELESIVKRERRKLGSRLEVLLMHLLKCEFQPERLSESWLRTLDEQRRRIDQISEG